MLGSRRRDQRVGQRHPVIAVAALRQPPVFAAGIVIASRWFWVGLTCQPSSYFDQ